MVLKLYGFPAATCTRRVATVLFEKKVPFEFHTIDLTTGAHKAPAYLEHQPFGQTPYIDDDGFEIYESRAIGRYIALKYKDQGTPLIPVDATADLKKTTAFEVAMQIENQELDPYSSAIVIEAVFAPAYKPGYKPRKDFLDEKIAILNSKLDVFEQILSKQKYLAGDEITLADLNGIPFNALLNAAGVDALDTRPAVSRWWKDLQARPSFLAFKDGVVAVEKY
ncbi:thioredoxin-like protein [Cylindrobasidium torrendii FP15055 ss-10]|uniref:glutathione transferase n=1 Tax=Cylindrobasidium torrendii FP15055 ss-10 TaxID=1314674 RepID=A0A0D7BEG3_9AGAR|nr:thioredoxin-like protein [Cylindrobasidium torrendii FP15055 ss-10]